MTNLRKDDDDTGDWEKKASDTERKTFISSI